MGYVVLLLMFYFILIRDIASYHPKLLLKKYIVLKNNTLSKILISKKVDGNVITNKEDQNKMIYSGIIFYIVWILVLVLSFVILKVIPIEPLNNNTYINSVNMRTVISLIYIFGMTMVSFFLINRCMVKESKQYKVFSIFLSCFMICGIIVNLLIAFGAY